MHVSKLETAVCTLALLLTAPVAGSAAPQATKPSSTKAASSVGSTWQNVTDHGIKFSLPTPIRKLTPNEQTRSWISSTPDYGVWASTVDIPLVNRTEAEKMFKAKGRPFGDKEWLQFKAGLFAGQVDGCIEGMSASFTKVLGRAGTVTDKVIGTTKVGDHEAATATFKLEGKPARLLSVLTPRGFATLQACYKPAGKVKASDTQTWNKFFNSLAYD